MSISGQGFYWVETPTFTESRDAINPDVRRMDDILGGAMWAIENGADKLPVVVGNLRIVKTDPFPGAPALRIWFTLDEVTGCATLLLIDLIEDPMA